MPLRSRERRLPVTQTGTRLASSMLKTAWQRLIVAAMSAGVIATEDRFNLHGLKHRCITDTPGTRAVKRDGVGHVSPPMTVRYDHDMPVVTAPKLPVGAFRGLMRSLIFPAIFPAEEKGPLARP